MRIARRILSPIVVLIGYAMGYVGLTYLTEGSLDVLDVKTPTLDGLLLLVISALAWACYAWLALGTVLMALSAIPGAFGSACGAVAERVTPAAYRRVAKFALGISIAAGPVFGALPASAAPVDNPTQAAAAAALPSLDRPGTTDARVGTSAAAAAAALPSLDRPGTSQSGQVSQALPSPDRPVTGQSSNAINPDRPQTGDALNRATRSTGAEDQIQTQHVVKRGDTLWDIAKSQLPDGASSAQINHEWHRWYEANRQVIGEDPDLILPGQVLQAPPQAR